MNIYRISPVLWNQDPCTQALTVYGIDRAPADLPTCCSSRVKEDPAYYWDSPTFQRLLPPINNGTNAVLWTTITAWLSFAQSKGYTVTTDLSTLKPYSDIYISGP